MGDPTIDESVRNLVDANNVVLDQALADLDRLTEAVRTATLSDHDSTTIDLASKVLYRLIRAQRVHLPPEIR